MPDTSPAQQPGAAPGPIVFPHRGNTVAEAVSRQFANRPSLNDVVEQVLGERLLEHYPSLTLDLRNTKLATPNQRGGWDLKPLTDVALDHLGNGTPVNLSVTVDARRCFLTRQAPAPLTFEANGPKPLDMAVIERLIVELPAAVPIAFQQALTDYWNLDADAGISRWQWMGDLLAGSLATTANLLPAAQQEVRDALFTLTRYPDRRARLAEPHPEGFVHAYCLEACSVENGVSTRLLSPDVLLVQNHLILLCSASGSVEAFASMDAFTQAWGQRQQSGLQVDSITVKRYEPDGNLFDTQAALLLNRQLDDLEAIQLPALEGVRPLEQRFADVTDPTPWFAEAPAPDQTLRTTIQEALPQWLHTASAEDRFAYRQRLVEQARVRWQTGGASFLDGVENLHDFTTRTLREQMRRDHPESTVEPGNLALTFHVPVGDLHGGYLAPVTMSLTELAIKNLAGAPHGSMTLRDTSGASVPNWLTADYVLGEKGLFHSTPGLISQVDIGRHYPQKVRELLLDDSAQARRRESLFGQELTVRLSQQALEHKIRGQQGFTFQGYRYVLAVFERHAPGRVVDDQDIVMRPLAFARTPGALPDVAFNMFLIEPRDAAFGPHILYRPLYRDSLQQFSSRQALLEAVAQPGALQDSVQDWLPDNARPIYSHNGFHEPHILRFGQGDEAARWSAPAPAQLALDANGGEIPGALAQSLAAGNLTQYLYGTNARALVDLADRDSVSNAQSRWSTLLEGGWLLFNSLLLPLLRGPAMIAGWMLQLAVSLRHDLAALQGDDATGRELAWVDVLLNIGLILLHIAPSPSPPLWRPAKAPNALSPAAGSALPRPQALVEQGTVGVPSEPPSGDNTLVDFIHSNTRDASRRRLLDALLELHVPWPVPAPEPLEIGAFKGLYRIGQQWHASVAGLLFRVKIMPGLDEVYLFHPQKPNHPGFQLTRNRHGQWALDGGLKLRGGGPKNRLKAKLAEIDRKRTEATEAINRISDELSTQITRIVPIDRALDAARLQFETAHNALGAARVRLRAAPSDATALASHGNKVAQLSSAKTGFQIMQERFDRAAADLSRVRRELIRAYGQLKQVDSLFDYESQCAEQYLAILSTDEIRVGQLSSLYLATFTSDRGESLIELQDAIHDVPSIRYVTDLLENNFAASEQHAQAMIAIENTLEEMTQQLKTGAAQRLKYLKGHPQRRYYNRLNAILESLDVLTELSIDQSVPAITPQEQFFFGLHDIRQSAMASLEDSHLQLLTTEGFTASERKAVLANLIRHYTRRLQIYHSVLDLNSPLVRMQYMPLLIERLQTVRDSAEADLADLLREDEFLPPQPAPLKPVQAPSKTKRVFKSRDKGALVGDLQPAQTDMPFPTMVTRNPITQQISGRFMEHPNEGWVEIVEAPPAKPVDRPAARPLATLRSQAQQLLDEMPAIERSIEFQKRKLADPQRRDELNPQDWHDMLAHQADRITALAEEMATHHPHDVDVPKTLERLRQRSEALRKKAVQDCIEGYKAQRPRQENIEFLRAHAAVDIGLVHGPKRTAAKDYLVEFAVREKNAQTVLWYAHFHYKRADTPLTEYTAAHLKRPGQRFLTFKDLLAQAGADSRTIVRDLYNPITAPLDQRLFLSLVPA